MLSVVLGLLACWSSPRELADPLTCAARHSVDSQYDALRFGAESRLRTIASALSAPVVETRALVEARVYDCEHRPSSGVRLEVWNARDDGYRYCADCRILYPGNTGEPEPTQTQFASNSDAPAWIALTPREVVFIVREVATQRPISVFGPVAARPGFMRLVLTPSTEAQLAALPSPVRLGP